MEENIITIELPDGTLERVAIAGTEPTAEELKAIQDTFYPSTANNDVPSVPDPEANAPFTSNQYYEGGRDPKSLSRNTIGQLGPMMGFGDFSDKDKQNPIYLQLSNNAPGWSDMSLREQRNLFDNAILDANREIFDQQGEENAVGLKVQRSTDEDGNPVTFLVPPAESASSSRFDRVMAGGGFEIAKGAGRIVEGVTDLAGKASDASGLSDALGFRVGTDPETDFVKENFPTIPPEDTLEAVGTEVVSILVGSVGGAGLASKLETAYGMAPKAARFVADKWSKITKSKPDSLDAAAQAFAKVFIIGTGANLGATATTPQQSDPLFGDEVVEFLGITPEENRNLTNFADNVTFSAGLMTLGKLAKGVKNVAGKALPLGILKKKNRDIDQGAALFKMLDPNLEEGIPASVFAERARILGEVIESNSTFKSELLSNGEISTDTTTALFIGAQDYVRRAYAWQKSYMGEEAFNAFVDETASTMAGRMASIRQTRRPGSEILASAESAMDSSMQSALTNTAEDLGGVGATDAAARELAQPIVDDVVEASSRVANTKETVEMAEAGLNNAQTQNYITELLRDVIRNNPLGSNVATRDALDTMTGEQLYNTWRKSFSGYNDAFKNLPDIPLPVDDFVRLIEDNFPDPKKWPDIIESVTLTDTVADPFPKLLSLVTPKSSISPSGDVVTETYAEMVERLSMRQPSFKDVFTQLRPQIEDRIQALLDRGLVQQAQQLIGLKRGIDTMAENIGDPAFIQAKDMYAKHAGTWLNSAPLRNFEAAAKNVNTNLVDGSGVAKGMPDAQRAGANARTEALEGGFLPYQKAFARALDTDTATPGMAMAYISEAINGVRKGLGAGELPGSQNVIEGIQQYLPVLERLAPDQVARFKSVVEDLSMAEAGLMSAKEAQASAELAYQEVLKQAKADSASRFIFDLTGNPTVGSNAPAAFNQIFNSKDSVDIMQRLIAKAEQSGDPLVIEGMQSQYLTWLSQKVTTNKRTALAATGPETTVPGYSPAQLSSILRDPASPVLKTLSTLFKNDLDRAAEVVRLLEIKDLVVNGRALRGDTFGSTTTYDKDVKKLMDRMIVVSLGVLNPTATVARNLSEAMTKGYRDGIQQAADETFDLMVANPAKFNEIMQLLAQNNEKGAKELWTIHLGRASYGTFQDEQTREALPVE